jgi:hypothetical protein
MGMALSIYLLVDPLLMVAALHRECLRGLLKPATQRITSSGQEERR